jgi:predicted amidohydrolase
MNIISAVQFKPRMASCAADVADNFRRCEGLVHDAWRVGSSLVVFPELFLTGYSFMSGLEAQAVAEAWDGRTFKSMRGVAMETGAYVAWGYVEGSGPHLHNSATVVAPNGMVVCRYRKINLWGNDFLWATPGKEPPRVADTELGKLSVVVCRDIRDEIPGNIPRTASGDDDPPMFQRDSPDLVAACTNWGKGGFPSATWMKFVADNACVMALANRWGVEERESGFRQDFGQGGSVVIEPDWTVHTSGLKFNADCVVTAAVEGRK